MTGSGCPPRDGPRIDRLRALTRLTVLAWVTALGLATVPVVAGAAGAGAPADGPSLDARPVKTPAASTPKPRPTAKPKPSRNPRSTASPPPTLTPGPTAQPAPTRGPRPTANAGGSPTPRPTHGNGGVHGKPSATPTSNKGGVSPGTNGSGTSAGQSTSGGSPVQAGGGGSGTTASAPAPFSVPGSVPVTGSRGRPGEGSESLFSGSLFLDFDLASSIDLLTPAALLALPGLLIMLSLVAQIAGGIVWIPITRRLLGDPAGPGGGGARRPR